MTFVLTLDASWYMYVGVHYNIILGKDMRVFGFILSARMRCRG